MVSESFISIPSEAQIAQSVEQKTENLRVGGSIPPLGTTYRNNVPRGRFFINYERSELSNHCGSVASPAFVGRRYDVALTTVPSDSVGINRAKLIYIPPLDYQKMGI